MKSIITIFIITCIFTTAFVLNKTECNTKINLRFNLAYKEDSIDKQKKGLLWALSFLGAELPKGTFERSLIKKDSTIFELDVTKVGFNKNAINALSTIIENLKESEEYKQKKGIDLGEFIIYTLGSSWHYYEITGVCKTINEFKQKHNFNNAVVFPVTNSSVAKGHRLIEITNTNEINKIAFLAHEGTGEINNNTFNSETTETVDIMKNGQQRFAIYNKEGNLIASSERKFGEAGKPIKCLWCHEIYIQPLYLKNEITKGYISPLEFDSIVNSKMDYITSYRNKLKTDLNYSKKQEHTLMELLYITYMEPSKLKLENEWGINPFNLETLFIFNKTHQHKEFKYLENLRYRNEIKTNSPYESILLPDSVRDENIHEPNLFKK